jgi:hypothetical protein
LARRRPGAGQPWRGLVPCAITVRALDEHATRTSTVGPRGAH